MLFYSRVYIFVHTQIYSIKQIIIYFSHFEWIDSTMIQLQANLIKPDLNPVFCLPITGLVIPTHFSL